MVFTTTHFVAWQVYGVHLCLFCGMAGGQKILYQPQPGDLSTGMQYSCPIRQEFLWLDIFIVLIIWLNSYVQYSHTHTHPPPPHTHKHTWPGASLQSKIKKMSFIFFNISTEMAHNDQFFNVATSDKKRQLLMLLWRSKLRTIIFLIGKMEHGQ